MNRDKRVFLATQKKAGIDNPTEADISRLGTVGKVLQLLRLPDGTVKALVEGDSRGRIVRFVAEKEYFQVEMEKVFDECKGFAWTPTNAEQYAKMAHLASSMATACRSAGPLFVPGAKGCFSSCWSVIDHLIGWTA